MHDGEVTFQVTVDLPERSAGETGSAVHEQQHGVVRGVVPPDQQALRQAVHQNGLDPGDPRRRRIDLARIERCATRQWQQAPP